jgi:hypothetical protein
MQLCAVVLDNYDLPPRELLKDLLESHTSLSAFDAPRVAAKARGIVVEVLPAAEAQALARELTAAGYAAQTLPRSEVVPFTRPRQVRFLNLSEAGLGCEYPPRARGEVAWDQVQVLALGQLIDETREVEVETVQVSTGRMAWKEHYHTTKFDRKKRVAADLIAELEDGEPLHIRIVGNDFNYGRSIKSDPTAGWLQNFTRLLAQLGLLATHTVIAPAYEAFILARDADLADRELPAFHAEDDFAAYARWLWQRKRMGEVHQ